MQGLIDLLQKMPVASIITIIVVLAAAFKSIVEFLKWFYKFIKGFVDKENQNKELKENIDEKFQESEERIQALEESNIQTVQKIDSMTNKIDLLINSDKDDIKSFLTREHHYFCYQLGWIDDYSLECCEKRYKHYKDEGGNSFIEGFMNELRALPKHDASKRGDRSNHNDCNNSN